MILAPEFGDLNGPNRVNSCSLCFRHCQQGDLLITLLSGNEAEYGFTKCPTASASASRNCRSQHPIRIPSSSASWATWRSSSRFSLSTLIFSVQAMSFPDESCQSTGLDDIIKFTLPNVGPASAKLGAGIPNCRGYMSSNTRWMKSRRQPTMPLLAQAHTEKTTVFAQGVP